MSKKEDIIIFKKDYLLECLKFTEEEAYEIMSYQKIIPILQKDNKEHINGRILHEQLKVGRDYTNWIKQQLKDVDAEKGKDFYFVLKGNKDFCSPSKANKKSGSGGHNKKEYYITIKIAKEIAMIAGVKGGNTNPELKEISQKVRKYFIRMEEAVKRDCEWQNIRNPQKDVTNRIRKFLYIKYIKTFKVKPKSEYLFTSNMDMINLIAFGFIAKEINEYLERDNDGKTRDHLRSECLERLTFLLDNHEILLKRGFDFDKRESELLEIYKAKYNNQLNPFTGKLSPIIYIRPDWWDMSNVI